MKKNLLLPLLLFAALLLTACGEKGGGDVEYMQKVLKEPETIEVVTGSSTVVYEKDTAEYRKLFDAFQANWWKTAKDTPDTAADDTLRTADDPASLKTTSNRTYATGSDTFVCFLYAQSPIQWYQADGSALEIKLIAFIMPELTETEENVKGFFTISKTENIGVNEGLFTYYYPAEMAGGLWDFLVH